MMKKNVLLVLLFAVFLIPEIVAQEKVNKQKEEVEFTTHIPEDKSSVYYVMYRSIVATQPYSYITRPFVASQHKDTELREGEGKNGYEFEAILNNVFTVLQGRDRSQYDFLKTSRVTINASVDMRMTQDESSPLIPNNYKIGLGINKSIWDSQRGLHLNPFKTTNNSDYVVDNGLHSVHLMILGQHYSNGQTPGFFYTDSSSGVTRNDYQSGDFSTNYVRLTTMYNINTKKNHLISFGLGYQWDLGGDSTGFAFTAEQNQYYGRQRLQLFNQYRIMSFMFPKWPLEFALRLEAEYIKDDVSKYEFRHNKAQRWSFHSYLTIIPLESRSLGLMVHYYYGRDYFNIRFDDIVSMVQFGFTFSLDKYNPPGVADDGTIKRMR